MTDWSNWRPKFAGLGDNKRLRPKDRSDSITYLDENAIHAEERDENGDCPFDVWASNFKQTVDLLVSMPKESHRHANGIAMVYTKQIRRIYKFTGDPAQRIKIPVAYRLELHQYDDQGRVNGGQAPYAYRVDEGQPQLSDLCAKNLADSIEEEKEKKTTMRPWLAPAPVAKTASERIAAKTPDELDKILMEEVE